jgi:hypothetical protein
MGKKISKKDSLFLQLIVTVNGVILGFSIAFFVAWSNFGGSTKWDYCHLKVLIPIWLGQLALSSSIFLGLFPTNKFKKSTRKKLMFWFTIIGIVLIILATIIGVCINFKN